MKRILVLDGGGGKAVYTIGVLYELEQFLARTGEDCRLCDFFDVFFGTSSGGIIATALASGMSAEHVYSFYISTLKKVMYLSVVSKITPRLFAKKRSDLLREELRKVFYDYPFDYIQRNLAIYATDYTEKIPRIFYTDARLAGGEEFFFTPGFGASIVNGLLATSAAYPIFDKVLVKGTEIEFEAVDGAFYANNPSLFALDAIQRAYPTTDCCMLNIGVGSYHDTQLNKLLRKMDIYNLLDLILESGAKSSINIVKRLSIQSGVDFLRINDTIPLEIDFFLQEEESIEAVFTCGRRSFREHQEKILTFLGI